MAEQTKPQWQREFPSYPVETMPPIPAGWSDLSWHNDAMPSFLITDSLGVWVDYLDPAHSDFPEWRKGGEMKRFTLVPMQDGQHIDTIDLPYLESDDWDEVLAMAESLTRPASVPPIAPAMLARLVPGHAQTAKE